MTDQALFAGTNFLTSILLARWLEPAAYGAFSLAYAVFLLVGTLHAGLLTEPMLVYGSGRFRESFNAYQRILLGYHWRFGALAALVFFLLATVSWAAGSLELAKSFLGLAFAAPAVLYLWIVRRGAYVLLEPRLAALGGGLYLLVHLPLAILLLHANLLDATTAFLAMAAAGLLAAEVIRSRLKAGTKRNAKPEEVRNLHWSYGRWALLAGLLSWVPANIFYLLLPAFHGLETAAQFKALMNLLMPILHFNGALGQLLVPGMVRVLSTDKLRRFALISLAVLVAFALTYWLLLAAVGKNLMDGMYGGKYIDVADWLVWLGIIPILASMGEVMSSALRAMEKPETVALVYGQLAVFTLLTGTILVKNYGIGGSIMTFIFSNMILSYSFFNKLK